MLKILPDSWLLSTPAKTPADAQLEVFGQRAKEKAVATSLNARVPAARAKSLLERKDSWSLLTESSEGLWAGLRCVRDADKSHGGQLAVSAYARARDLVGAQTRDLIARSAVSIDVQLVGCDDEELLGALVGLEMAAYRFGLEGARIQKLSAPRIFRDGRALTRPELARAARLGQSMNLARHLVNLPPNLLHTQAYASAVKALFKDSKTSSVEVWDEKKLEAQKMRLLLAVGNSAENGPRLVHIKYRPRGAQGKPIAFVGKGLVFDSGGLDIKPSAGMRLMKKDMGGSASVLGLAWYVESSGLKRPMDFYLALAENAVDAKSFRPGDIIVSRTGISIEIDNTDAEGRLVLADALNVAITAKDAPEYLIDVATLTGAGKIALGTELASLFSNDDTLARDLAKAGQERGDLSWRTPLFQPYMNQLKSSFADWANSAPGGYGGAITAALFLQKFVGSDAKWAHFDIYAWKDAPNGPFADKGGNGQTVQSLAAWLEEL
jgi:leucyl aminopeptidase